MIAEALTFVIISENLPFDENKTIFGTDHKDHFIPNTGSLVQFASKTF